MLEVKHVWCEINTIMQDKKNSRTKLKIKKNERKVNFIEIFLSSKLKNKKKNERKINFIEMFLSLISLFIYIFT